MQTDFFFNRTVIPRIVRQYKFGRSPVQRLRNCSKLLIVNHLSHFAFSIRSKPFSQLCFFVRENEREFFYSSFQVSYKDASRCFMARIMAYIIFSWYLSDFFRDTETRLSRPVTLTVGNRSVHTHIRVTKLQVLTICVTHCMYACMLWEAFCKYASIYF